MAVKKRNPQDATVRNVRAGAKSEAIIKRRLVRLEVRVRWCEDALRRLGYQGPK